METARPRPLCGSASTRAGRHESSPTIRITATHPTAASDAPGVALASPGPIGARGLMSDAARIDRDRIAARVRSRSGLAGHALASSDVDRFVASIELLPPPPATVLDVGCGTGILVDVLEEIGYSAFGLDTDESAMSAMSSSHDVGSIDAIPCADESFDVVVLNEILEHLPVGVYDRGLSESARVARVSVVVTVPNAESLESASTRCRACGCVYSIHGHVRRFEPGQMANLLPGFQLSHLATVGPFKLRHQAIEWHLRRRLLGRWPAQPGARCPQCRYAQRGTSSSTVTEDSLLRRVVRSVLAAPWDRWWMVARFDRVPLAPEPQRGNDRGGRA